MHPRTGANGEWRFGKRRQDVGAPRFLLGSRPERKGERFKSGGLERHASKSVRAGGFRRHRRAMGIGRTTPAAAFRDRTATPPSPSTLGWPSAVELPTPFSSPSNVPRCPSTARSRFPRKRSCNGLRRTAACLDSALAGVGRRLLIRFSDSSAPHANPRLPCPYCAGLRCPRMSGPPYKSRHLSSRKQ